MWFILAPTSIYQLDNFRRDDSASTGQFGQMGQQFWMGHLRVTH